MHAIDFLAEDLNLRTGPFRLVPIESRLESLVIPAQHLAEPSLASSYREVAPPLHLREHIVCFWHRPGGVPESRDQILPDGCIDIIWAGEAPPIVAGPMIMPLAPTINSEVEIIGVRFRPGIAPFLLGVSAREMRNQHVALGDIWPRNRLLPWNDATDRAHFAAKLEAVVAVIARQLGTATPPDGFVTEAARWIANHPTGNLDDLARIAGLSERQVRRRFDDAVGYGPKRLQRILRMQRLLWLAGQRQTTQLNLADLAFSAGYADQPHMTRELATLSGASPGSLLRGAISSAVSDLFKTSAP